MGRREMRSLAGAAVLLALIFALNGVDQVEATEIGTPEVQELGFKPMDGNAHSQSSKDTVDQDAMNDDEDVGENVGRRGGAFLSTTGSFTLSSGSNTAGNDEALRVSEARLGEDM